MHRIPINAAHNKIALEGFIFFAERIKELLAHSVDDSFKASALNTRTRALELERLLHHAYKTTQRATSLTPLLDEFEESVRNDPVIKELQSKDILMSMVEELKTAFTNEKPRLLTEAADTLKAISIMLGSYYQAAKYLIEQKINSKSEKKLISVLCETILIEIQFRGYSREHIRHISKTKLASKLLKSSEFDSKDALNDFFSSFNNKQKTFTCATRCNGEFDPTAAEALHIQLSSKIDGFRKKKLLHLDSEEKTDKPDEYESYITMSNVKAQDVFDAREKLYRALHLQNATEQFLFHKPNLSFSEYCLVRDDDTKEEIRIRKPINVMLIGQKHEKEEALQKKKDELLYAYSRFNDASRKTFVSAIKYHKEALDSLSIENQLVDLWASLEGFVPQPIDSSPRMASVLTHILPAQTLIYVEKKLCYVTEGIRQAGPKAIDIVSAIDIEGSFHRKVLAIILCPEFSSPLKQLMALLDHSPLLRFRIFSLFENFSTMEKAHVELTRHKKRLEWQLRRIYISRNTVMHSATSYGNLNLLVENLHSYLDILINATIMVAQQSPRNTTINSVLKLLGAYENSYLNFLAKSADKNQELNRNNFGHILFESNNPLLQKTN